MSEARREPRPSGQDETIMAIDMKENGSIGCAYYVAIDETLHLQEDLPIAGADLPETLLLHAQPTTVIASNRAPDRLLEYLESGGAYSLRVVRPSEFGYAAARDSLLSLGPELYGPQSAILTSVTDAHVGNGDSIQRAMRLATRINLNSQLSIGCAGAVLNELQRQRAAQYLPNDPPDAVFALQVKKINMIALADYMFLNADTLAALQVIGPESGITHTGGPDGAGAKEDLSIYGLLKPLASTNQGKARLRQMLLRPSVHLDTIRERQRTLAVLLRPENSWVLSSIVKILKRAKNVKTPILHLQKGVNLSSRAKSVEKSVWAALAKFSSASVEIREAARTLAGGEDLVVVSRLAGEIDPHDFTRVGDMIHSVVDFDRSAESNRTVVRQGVNAELDELKDRHDYLGGILGRASSRLALVIPEWASEHIQDCVFFPRLGFFTPVTLNPETGRAHYAGQDLADDVWEAVFTEEGHVHFKNNMMRELDEQVGDIEGMMMDKEVEIIHQLGIRVLEHETALTRASELLGELDSLVALALGAQRYHWTAPRMTTANTIDIRGGRHPLQELMVSSFIANDCTLCGGRGEVDGEEVPSDGPVLVLTGPNHSGKSVYLKQATLIVYLAHVGSHVPAEQATIGLTDKILTRISTRESMSRTESAFSIDLRQVATAINLATRRSLVLIDEFGKGTDANSGAGLMTAVLDHFVGLGVVDAPKVLVATHFHEIFENNFFGENMLVFAHMDVQIDRDARDPADQVAHLFQLVPGRSTSSFGSICAAVNGVDPAVVERAEALALLSARNEDLRAACARLSAAEERKLEEAESAARRFVEMDIAVGSASGVSLRAQLRDLVSERQQSIPSGLPSLGTYEGGG